MWESEALKSVKKNIKCNLIEYINEHSQIHTDLIGLGVIELTGGGSLGCGPSASPTTVTATGLCSVDMRSVLPLRDVEPERLNMPDKRPRKSFLLARMSLATLISESDP